MASRGGYNKNNNNNKKEAFVPKPALEVPKEANGLAVSFDIKQEAEIQEFFNKYGFVVVRDVLTPKDCKATVGDIFSILEDGTGFKRDDITTWSKWPGDSIEVF